MSNLSRVRLGHSRRQTTAVLGPPSRVESFLLTDATMVDVFFYHTAATVCRRPDLDAALIPFVFQNDRLMGYGQNYYQDFIIPSLRAAATPPTPIAPSVGAGIPDTIAEPTPSTSSLGAGQPLK